MPEGHVTHRLARELTAAFAGAPVRVSSPQGRFAEAAALLDGQLFVGAEAYGKNLFIGFGSRDSTDLLVHVHLGLIGKLRLGPALPVEAADTLRLRIDNGEQAAELRGPQTCALIAPAEQAAVTAGLGADPLRSDGVPEMSWARVSRSERAIASLLMDQRVCAGVGNIYRCEVLFRQRLHPMTPGRQVTHRMWNRIWSDLTSLMRLGVRDGRIDTVRPEHGPDATGRPPRVDRHGGEVYVYRRVGQPCLVCGRPISVQDFEARHLFWCGRCQRRR